MIVYTQPVGKLVAGYIQEDPQINGFDFFAVLGVEVPGDPTTVHHFTSSFMIGGSRIDGTWAEASQKITIRTCGHERVYNPGDSMENAAGSHPIPSGGAAEGIVPFMFPNESIAKTNFDTLQMSFEDVHDRVYSFTSVDSSRIFVLPGSRSAPDIPDTPGIGKLVKMFAFDRGPGFCKSAQ